MDLHRRTLEKMLDTADIRLDGSRPWDIRVNDERLFARVLAKGTLGAGEAYMDGWWDCDAIDEMVFRLTQSRQQEQLRPVRMLGHVLTAKMRNLQAPSRAFEVGRRHYDIGNDLFRAMLDSRMIYSCGYWQDADTLDDAQVAKLELIASKLMLKPGMRVLDIGCGWGGAPRYFARHYGVHVTGVTVSERQVELGRDTCAGLPVELRLQDYRELEEEFDRIYSIGMFEHVGPKNYRSYMQTVRRCLDDDGLFLLHTIGSDTTHAHTDPWIHRYIFPNGCLPSAKLITDAAEGLLVLEDWHNFGPDYDRTLLAWHDNFESAWPQLSKHYDERFHRAWRYYLLISAGAFRSRSNELWQIVWSTGSRKEPYRPARAR